MTQIVNPHAPPPTSLTSMMGTLWRNRRLIWQMSQRDVVGRYRGSIMGLAWSFFNPVLMLIVYTFVFSVVFNAKWGGSVGGSKSQFAIILFVGIIVHSLFSEVLNRAPTLMLTNINFVKKVVFPIEILPAMAMGSSLFHSVVSIIVFQAAFVIINGFLNWTIVFLPIILLPMIVLVMGFAWMLASLGVFIRDVSQGIGLLMTVLLFLSPVFYPLSALPETYQNLLMLNPITFIIEQARDVLIWGREPNWVGLAIYSMISLLISWLGYWWFQKTRKGFSDVL